MGQRPPHVRPPAHLSKSPPLPQPAEAQVEPPSDSGTDGNRVKPDPTRYGDWVIKGIAIDF